MTRQLSLREYIDEYKSLPPICAKTDFADKKSVRRHNATVSRMYKIVEAIKVFGSNGVEEFSKLLDISENDVNVWVAVQILEKLSADSATEKKALEVIKKVANGNDINAYGFQIWLKQWMAKSPQ